MRRQRSVAQLSSDLCTTGKRSTRVLKYHKKQTAASKLQTNLRSDSVRRSPSPRPKVALPGDPRPRFQAKRMIRVAIVDFPAPLHRQSQLSLPVQSASVTPIQDFSGNSKDGPESLIDQDMILQAIIAP